MKRVIRLFARLYPRVWRRRYGDEFDALLDDAKPSGRAAFDVFKGALAMQMETGDLWRPLILAGTAGALLALSISLAMPRDFRSEATVLMTPGEAGVRPGGGSRLDLNAWDATAKVVQSVLSTRSLISVIEQQRLYQSELSRMPLDSVAKLMRKNITLRSIETTAPWGVTQPVFAIEFRYPDRYVARNVTSELVRRLIETNLSIATLDSSVILTAQYPATLPLSPSGPSRVLVTAGGLLAGLCASVLFVIIRCWRRSWSL